MVQDQLVDYISAQMKLGASRDAIKTSLLGAGWQAADVEDTLKKIEGAGKPATAAPMMPASSGPKPMSASSLGSSMGPSQMVSPVSLGSSSGGASSFTAAKPTGVSTGQTIRVSDLVSAGASSSPSSAIAMDTKKPAASPQPAAMPSSSFDAKMKSMPMSGSIETKKRGGAGGWIVAGLAIVLFGGAAGYFYMQAGTLNDKVNSLTSQSASVASQISSLKTQLNASTSALTSQVNSLTGQNSELAAELSLYVVNSSATSTSATLTGTVGGGGKGPFTITIADGAKAFVKNSTDAKVSAALTPLIGKSAQVSGTIISGSQNITVTAVNGASL